MNRYRWFPQVGLIVLWAMLFPQSALADGPPMRLANLETGSTTVIAPAKDLERVGKTPVGGNPERNTEREPDEPDKPSVEPLPLPAKDTVRPEGQDRRFGLFMLLLNVLRGQK